VRVFAKTYGFVKELAPVLVVALVVVAISTLGESAFTKFRQAGAEEHASPETASIAGPAGFQTLTIKDWGVQLKLPLAAEMPLVLYATESPSNIGFSSSDLEKYGAKCLAGKNALGALTRIPAGQFANYAKGAMNATFVGTVGQYDYAYDASPGGCADTETTSEIVNREVSVLSEALSGLAAIQN
jgi:hypothetical protein